LKDVVERDSFNLVGGRFHFWSQFANLTD